MKKVILEDKKEEVYLSDLNNNSIVGILWQGNKKGSILFDNGNYKGFDNHSLDISVSWSENSIKDYLNTAKEHSAEFFIFDTIKELFKWLSED